MLIVHQLAKSFALTSLFDNVTFSLNAGDRVGLVGPNGCGKSTLLRLIAGKEAADSGQVTIAPGLRIGYLPQGFELDPELEVELVVNSAVGDITSLETELIDVAQAMANQPDSHQLQTSYDRLLQRISRADSGHATSVLTALELDDLPPHLRVRQLSGGQKTRLNLALILLDDPQILLLDEPTNHLDIAMLEWLEGWLASFPGAALIVSHDRTFLDRAVTRILHMNPQQKSVKEYAGNYASFADQVQLERKKQWAAYNDQQQEIRRLQQDIARTRAQAERTEWQASSVRRGGEKMKLKGYKDYQRSIAKKVAQKAKARAQKLERYLDAEERVERPRQARKLRLDFAGSPHLGRSVISLQELSIGYDPNDPLLCDLQLDLNADDRIVLAGPNGSGKSTLLKTIGGELAPLDGRVELGPSVRLGTMTQEQTGLDLRLSPLETVQFAFGNETEARTFLSYFLFTGDEPLLLNSRLSYGQRARLALARLIVHGCNVLLLDEPINHLDIPSREQFEQALAHFEGAVLAVVHDRTFIERFASEIWWVENSGIRREIGSYSLAANVE